MASPKHAAFRSPGLRLALGVVAGLALFILAMVLLAVIAGLAGWFRATDSGTFDLTAWLRLELLGGTLVSIGAGALARHLGQSVQAPRLLALILFCLALAESVILTSLTGSDGVAIQPLLVWLAPVVVTLGTLLGGWRPRRQQQPGRRHGWPRAATVVRFSIPITLLAAATYLAIGVLPELHDRSADITAAALAVDFTISVPILAYFLLVRPRRVPPLVLFPIVVIGVALASAVIPAHHDLVHTAIRWGVIPLEIGLLTYLVVLTRRTLRQQTGPPHDFAERFRTVSRQVLGNRIAADILTTEIAILYYAFRPRQPRLQPERDFTVFREVGYSSVLVTLLVLFAVETIALHLIVSQWSTAIAWLLTGLSLYGAIWFIGDYRALQSRPIELTTRMLTFRQGLRWETVIPRNNVIRVEIGSPPDKPHSKDVVVVGMLSQANVQLLLAEPVTLIGMYGLQKSGREIWIQVDDAARFCRHFVDEE